MGFLPPACEEVESEGGRGGGVTGEGADPTTEAQDLRRGGAGAAVELVRVGVVAWVTVVPLFGA